MKLAIHHSPTGYSSDWIAYCERNHIPFKVVSCYDTNIVEQLNDCDALLWHHHHTGAKDVLFAKQLLFALQQAGKLVFPDFNTGWHFDDKVGQKYLLEAIEAPLVPSYTFYSKQEAQMWIEKTSFPKVAKLRGGAGSTNVRLIETAQQAKHYVNKAFSKGFATYDKWNDLQENIRRFRLGKSAWISVAKSVRRIFYSTDFAKVRGRERGYVYFQDFVPNNSFDTRVVTIGNRAFAIKRLVRNGDFRASGSGFIQYEKTEIDERCIELAFEVSHKLKAQVVAYDFVFDKEEPKIVEINYGYAHQSYFDCPGYWTSDLQWHEHTFNSAEWIIESIVHTVKLNYSV